VLLAAFLFRQPPLLAALTFLHTRGEDIVDENGKKIMLRGVGLGNWMLPEGYMWKFGQNGDRPRKIEKVVTDLIGPEKAAQFWSEFRKNYITEADVARIAELGFNSVRPALNSRLFLTEGDNCQYLDEGFQLLDNLVVWCRTHRLYVILDMHGAPGGQTGANIDDSSKDQPELFIDKRNQDRLVDLWVKIAQRYKDEPTVAAYDLLNEPLPKRTGAADKYKDQLEPLYKRITSAIRKVDARHMITLEGFDWANDWSIFSAPFDPNLFYQFHFYCWDQPTKLNSFDRYLAHRERLKAPVWAGETGEKDNAIYWATTQSFEANNIGWSFWPWKKMDTRNTPYSIKQPEGWEAVRGYSSGKPKPSSEAAQKAFDQLLVNIRLANCDYFPDVVNAILRRVPGKVEGEDYGPDGLNKSYFVKNPAQKAKYYRLAESVPIERVEGANRWSSGQAIHLQAEEWTEYVIGSEQARDYSASCRIKTDGTPAVIQLLMNGKSQEQITFSQSQWAEVPLKPVAFATGANHLKFLVKSGSVSLDYLTFR